MVSQRRQDYMEEENQFEIGQDMGSDTTLIQAGKLIRGSRVMIQDKFPCRVTDFNKAKTGKHGSAKIMLDAKDIFTGKHFEDYFGTKDMISAPIVEQNEYTVIGVGKNGNINVLDDNCKELVHLCLPKEDFLKEVADKIEKVFAQSEKTCIINVQKWGNKEQIIACKEGESC